MPELPEVQTIVNGLNKKVLKKKIIALFEHRMGTVQNFMGENFCKFGTINTIKRRGKYIIFETSENLQMIVHLRMTGKLIFENKSEKLSKHSRAEIIFSDNSKIVFDDARTFGKIQIYEINKKISCLEKLGAEPLTNDFNEKYLQKIIRNKKAPIKNLLLNQYLIAGLGNIYVAELLYRAKISPKKESGKLTSKEIKKIVKQTKSVLREAIKHNGTTISDYRSIYNKTGEFQNFLKVYQKKVCECGNEISRIKQAGRSTYYCKKCQK